VTLNGTFVARVLHITTPLLVLLHDTALFMVALAIRSVGRNVLRCAQIKMLGVTFSRKFSVSRHVDDLLSRWFQSLFALRTLRQQGYGQMPYKLYSRSRPQSSTSSVMTLQPGGVLLQLTTRTAYSIFTTINCA